MKTKTTKSGISYGLSLIALLLCSFNLSAGNQRFELSGITADNNGPLNDVKVIVFEESVLMTEVPTKVNGKFTFTLEFNKKFKIIIEKEGYVSETININTTLPNGSPEQNMSHEISLKMFSISESTPFSFDQAVANVFFNQVIKSFTNEISYKKTFPTKIEGSPSVHNKLGNEGISADYKYQLSLRRYPKKEEIKAEEEITVVKQENPMAAAEVKKEVKVESITIIEVAMIATTKVTEAEIVNTVSDSKPAIETKVEVAAIKKEKKYVKEEPKKVVYAEPVKKEVKKLGKEVIIEDTRQINKEVIKSHGKIIEFSYITYNNGGIYYFKNGACISAETYQRELKYINQ